MTYPCNDCPFGRDKTTCKMAQHNQPGCGTWKMWFLDAWGSARIGVLANAMGYKKAAHSAANTANGKDKTTTHIIAEEG